MEDFGFPICHRPPLRRRGGLFQCSDVTTTDKEHVLQRDTRVQEDRHSHLHRWTQASQVLSTLLHVLIPTTARVISTVA